MVFRTAGVSSVILRKALAEQAPQAKDLIARTFKALRWRAAMRSFAALRTTEGSEPMKPASKVLQRKLTSL